MGEHKCRHYLGLFPGNRPSCKMGRDVRAWAVRCNGGDTLGIGLRLPCTKQLSDEKPLFDCPELDRKTDEEVESERREHKAHISRFLSGMSALSGIKERMISEQMETSTEDCPWCGGTKTLSVGVAIEVNNHIRAHCSACDMGIIE